MEDLWLKALGSAEAPLPRLWLHGNNELLRAIRFPPKRVPSLQKGDLVLYYAAVWQKVFAAARLTSDAKFVPKGNPRWPWKATVEVFLLVPDLDYAPTLHRAKVDTLSVRNKSHIRITQHQYREAVAGLAEAAGFDDETYAALAGYSDQ